MAPTIPDQDYLIQTKLYPPRTSVKVVRRGQLIDRLNEDSSRRLTLISAAAGYGKSTLIAQWLFENEQPYGWLSLDDYDSKLDQFVDYLIAAIRTLEPDITWATKDLLKLPRLPGVVQLANRFLRDLQELSQSVFLVLDDYHVIQSSEVHEFVSRLIQQPPVNLHLVIITRMDPPLPLATMRGRSQLLEIRSHDLCFSFEEAAILLEQIVGEPIGSEMVVSLSKHTEGWPAGLRMAATSLLRSDDYGKYVQRYAERGQKPALDYLLSEVLDNLPREERLLMLATSVVDRICAPLIDELSEGLTAGISGSDLLEELWSSNFFVVALDDQGIWYRYHQLFRQLLLQQLNKVYSSQAIAALHLRASAWLENAGFIEEAVTHALDWGDTNRAAKIIERHVHEPINYEDWRLVDRWINLIPAKDRRWPGLLAAQAMLEQVRFRINMILPLLNEAEEKLNNGDFIYSPEEKRAWMGVISAFRGITWLPSNTPQDSLNYMKRAEKQVHPSARYVRSLVDFWEIYALQQSGDAQGAIDLAQRKLASYVGPSDVFTNRVMLGLSGIYLSEANFPRLCNLAMSLIDIAENSGQKMSMGWAYCVHGMSLYEANQLEDAERSFEKVLELRDAAHVRAVVDSITGLVFIYRSRREMKAAQEKIDYLREFILEQRAFWLLELVDSLAWSLDPESATTASQANMMRNAETQLAADLWESPVLTACQCAIKSGDQLELSMAENALNDCHVFALSRNNKRKLIKIDALLSSLYELSGEHEKALHKLAEAVRLGEPGNALRCIVDIGPSLIPLLHALRDEGVTPAYVGRILNAYGEAELEVGDQTGNEHETLSQEAIFIIGELTAREMEVLILLNRRLTNKEIASELNISPSTVTKHSVTLYEKLGVHGRRRAVARANELGILPNR